MARGWEKEDVDIPEVKADPVTPRAAAAADSDRQRRLQELKLQRERILSERTASPHRRNALQSALLEIEERLGELGWDIHI